MPDTNHSNSFDLSNITTYQAGTVQAASHRLLQKYSDGILKPYGITKMQWLIIGTILDSGPAGARITDIAKTLDTTLPYLTNTLNVLEARGVIVRVSNKGDSRSKMARISTDFEPKCAAIEQILREKLRETIYAKVSPADFRTYMRVMYQLVEGN